LIALQGSTFRFAIPAALASPPPDSKESRTVSSNLLAPPKRNLKRPLSSGELILPPFSKNKTAALHVLIVEDNLINQKVMKRQLMIEKFVVTVANDGQEALDILQAEAEKVTNPNPISIVLMDIEMPRMDGLTAIKELRAREKSGAIPVRFAVIAVTGNARQGQIDTCLAAGFDDVS
jgi:CheY-like chemotaxis protein